jgi:hypothetical protein
MFPLLGGIMGLKPEKKAFYVSAAVSVLTFLLSKIFLFDAHSYFLPLICVGMSGIAFFSVHFVQHGGLVWINYGEGRESRLW